MTSPMALRRRRAPRPPWVHRFKPLEFSLRGQQDTASDTAAISFTLGADTVVGDLVVLIQSNNFYAASNLQTPTGTAVSSWSLRTTVDGGTNDHHAKVWTGVVTTGGASTVVVNNSTTDEERYAGVWVASGAEYDTSAGTETDTAGTSHAAPSLTPTSGNTNGILICHWGAGVGSVTNYTIPVGMSAYTEYDIGASGTFRSAIETLSSDAATGTRTATASTSIVWYAVSVLLKPVTAVLDVDMSLSSETDTAQDLTLDKSIALAQAQSADTSQTPDVTKTITLGLATEADSATSPTASKSLAVGLSPETDTANAVALNKVLSTGLATETDTANQLTTQTVGINLELAVETDTALAFTVSKSVNTGLASETDTSNGYAAVKMVAVALVAESDTAFDMAFYGEGEVNLLLAVESDTALGMTVTRFVELSLGSETDSANVYTVDKSVTTTYSTETDTAFPLEVLAEGAVALGLSSETDIAFGVTVSRLVTLSISDESDSALALVADKSLAIALASETDTAGVWFLGVLTTTHPIVTGPFSEVVLVNVGAGTTHSPVRSSGPISGSVNPIIS